MQHMLDMAQLLSHAVMNSSSNGFLSFSRQRPCLMLTSVLSRHVAAMTQDLHPVIGQSSFRDVVLARWHMTQGCKLLQMDIGPH